MSGPMGGPMSGPAKGDGPIKTSFPPLPPIKNIPPPNADNKSASLQPKFTMGAKNPGNNFINPARLQRMKQMGRR